MQLSHIDVSMQCSGTVEISLRDVLYSHAIFLRIPPSGPSAAIALPLDCASLVHINGRFTVLIIIVVLHDHQIDSSRLADRLIVLSIREPRDNRQNISHLNCLHR